jgi:uroporphyrinogen III methyltransferase/synthase
LGEELAALEAAGVPYEIVPGLSAAMAAGSYAGISLTHRDHASCVAFVTGQENPAKLGDEELDYAALAGFPGTLVFYMGVTTADRWSRALVEHGKSPKTPVAIIRRCSFPDQETILGTLGEVPELLAPGTTRPPAIVIVGDVVQAAQLSTWFTSRPLFGQSILVTRPIEQAEALAERLHELGAEVFFQPAIEILPAADPKPIEAAIGRLADYDWLVFLSSNGVEFFFDRLHCLGLDSRALGTVKLAAIGPATVEALEGYFLHADVQPETYRAEALAEALADEAAGKRFLIARASRGREILAELLTQAGATVEQVVVYESRDVAAAEEDVASRMAAGKIDWTTVTSSAIARSLVSMFGEELKKTHLAAISPLTAEVLAELGHPAAVVAESYTTDGLIEAILEQITKYVNCT